LAIWLALLPSDHMFLRVSTRSSVQDMAAPFGPERLAMGRPEAAAGCDYSSHARGSYKHAGPATGARALRVGANRLKFRDFP
jgi:hypothetical protein